MSLPNLLVSTLKLNTSWGTSWGWSYIPLCPAFFGFRVADCRHQQAFVYLSIPPKRTCLSPEISQLDFSFLKPNTKIWTGKNDMDIKYSNTVMLTQEKFTDPYDFSMDFILVDFPLLWFFHRIWLSTMSWPRLGPAALPAVGPPGSARGKTPPPRLPGFFPKGPPFSSIWQKGLKHNSLGLYNHNEINFWCAD